MIFDFSYLYRINRFLPLLICIAIISGCKQNSLNRNTKLSPFSAQTIKSGERMMIEKQPKAVLKQLDRSFAELKNPDKADAFCFYLAKSKCYNYLNDTAKTLEYIDTTLNILLNNRQLYRNSDLVLEGAINGVLIFNKYKKVEMSALFLYSLKRKLNANNTENYYYILSQINSSIASFNFHQKKYKQAIRLYQLAAQQLLSCEYRSDVFLTQQGYYDNIGYCYNKIGMPDSAIVYYTKGIELIKKNYPAFKKSKGYLMLQKHFVETSLGIIYGNRGKSYLDKGELNKAEADCKRNIQICFQPEYNMIDGCIAHITLGEVYLKKRFLDSTLRVLKITEPYLEQDQGLKIRYLKLHSDYLSNTHNYKLAYKTLVNYNKLKYTYDNRFSDTEGLDFQREFDRLEQRSNLEVLNKDNQLKKIYLIATIVLGSMSVIILLIVLNGRKRERKTMNDMLKLNKQLALALSSLEQSNQDYSEMMSVLAHELHTPITTITHAAETLLLNNQFESDDANLINSVQNTGVHMIAVIENLLSVRKNTDIHTTNSEPTDVNDLLLDSIALMRYSARLKNINLIYQPALSVFVNIKRENLWRIINNLTINAIKFSNPGTDIEIVMLEEDQFITIQIKDNGIGIPEKLKSQLFELFTSSSRAGTNNERSFGLGLYITRQITTANNGEIWFTSTLNKGTTFFVKFPSVEPKEFFS